MWPKGVAEAPHRTTDTGVGAGWGKVPEMPRVVREHRGRTPRFPRSGVP